MTRAQELAAVFALGAVAGGAAALLLAPEKGEVTRRRLQAGAAQLAKRGEIAAGEIRGAVDEAIKGATHAVRQQAQAVKGALAEGTKAYREELQHAGA